MLFAVASAARHADEQVIAQLTAPQLPPRTRQGSTPHIIMPCAASSCSAVKSLMLTARGARTTQVWATRPAAVAHGAWRVINTLWPAQQRRRPSWALLAGTACSQHWITGSPSRERRHPSRHATPCPGRASARALKAVARRPPPGSARWFAWSSVEYTRKRSHQCSQLVNPRKVFDQTTLASSAPSAETRRGAERGDVNV